MLCYRRDAAEAVAALVKHCETYFGTRMAIYNLMEGISCEWQGCGSHTSRLADFSSSAQKGFSAYLKQNVAKLSGAKNPLRTARLNHDGKTLFRNPKHDRGCSEHEVHALYNLYLIEALDCYIILLRACNESSLPYQRTVRQLRNIMHTLFYEPKLHLYASRYLNGKLSSTQFHLHTQIMMLYTGCVPKHLISELLQKIHSDNNLIPMTLSSLPYYLWALKDKSEEDLQKAITLLERNYFGMLTENSNTLWETINGGDDFKFAGSLCHGWSSLPIYYLYMLVLGGQPIQPGFKRFLVKPNSRKFCSISGGIPTPHGNIEIRWNISNNKTFSLHVKYPQKLTPELYLGHLKYNTEFELEPY